MPRFWRRERLARRSDGTALPLLRKDSDDGVERQSRPQRHEPQMASESPEGARGGRLRNDPAGARLLAMPPVGKGDQAGTATEGPGPESRILSLSPSV